MGQHWDRVFFKGVPPESIENTSFTVYWDNKDNKIL